VRQPAGARRVGAAIAVVLALAGGCSAGDDDPTLSGDIPTTDASDTTSSTSASTTTTTAEPACPPVEHAGQRAGLVEQPADVDGDGHTDLAQSYPDGDHVTLLVDLAAGGGASLALDSSEDVAVELLGGAVLDAHDRRQVLWVRVGAGASATVLGLYHLDGCSLRPASFENGDPVELPIGGTVGTVSGARCGSVVDAEADLLVFEATHISGRDYEIVTTEYRWQDGRLVRSPESAPTVARSDDLSEASSFACGDLSL
jgi:hypothetical protein